MKKFLQEFKTFALRGNVVDLAVGVMIGAAFQSIVKSLTDDIISPLIGLFANLDFNDVVFTIKGVDIRYGAFFTTVINFLIMVFLIFLLVKGMNKLSQLGKQSKTPVKQEATTKVCPFCCTEISIKAVRCPHCTSDLEV